MKKVLVTGNAGFLGQNLVQFFQKQGVHVVGIDRRRAPFVEPDTEVTDDLNTMDFYALKRLISDCEAVIHLAGCADPFGSWEECRTDNINPIVRLCRLSIPRLVFSSTAAVYGEAKDLSPRKEDDPLNSISFYGTSKVGCERVIGATRKNAVIFRIGNVFGPYGSKYLIDKLFAGKDVVIFNGGRSVRDFLYAEDFCRAVVHVLQPTFPCGVYNLAGGLRKSVSEVVSEVSKYMNIPISVVEEMRGVEPEELKLDTSLISSYGWRPKTDFEAGIMKIATQRRRMLNKGLI